MNAVCLVRGPSGEREVPIDDFLEGPYETSLAYNEMLVEVRIPVRHNSSSAYAKVERRVGDWAVAAAGAAVTLDGDIDRGRPRRSHRGQRRRRRNWRRSGEVAGRRPATEEIFAEAGRRAAQACEPVTDMRGSADYKRHLAAELTIRTLRTAVERVREHLTKGRER